MKIIEATKIIGETLYELRKFHHANVITSKGEKILEVAYNKGFIKKYTYGRIGDYVAYYGNTNVCIPKELYDEFSSGWIHNDKWNEHTEPFVDYYELFASTHSDKIIHKPMFSIMNKIRKLTRS